MGDVELVPRACAAGRIRTPEDVAGRGDDLAEAAPGARDARERDMVTCQLRELPRSLNERLVRVDDPSALQIGPNAEIRRGTDDVGVSVVVDLADVHLVPCARATGGVARNGEPDVTR